MPREYDSYEVEIEDWQIQPEQRIVELEDDQAQDLAVRVLEDALELVEDTSVGVGGSVEDVLHDGALKAAIVTVLRFMDGGWGHYGWPSLADKRKHEASRQLSKSATTGGSNGRTD